MIAPRTAIDVYNVAHPRPRSPQQVLGKTARGGGKYQAVRIVRALAAEADDDGLTAAELALGLGIRKQEAALMCGSAWRTGLVVFNVVGGESIYRLTPAGRAFAMQCRDDAA